MGEPGWVWLETVLGSVAEPRRWVGDPAGRGSRGRRRPSVMASFGGAEVCPPSSPLIFLSSRRVTKTRWGEPLFYRAHGFGTVGGG